MTPTDTSREKIDLILVSCCGQKLKGTHPAGHIYQSQLFNAAARYAGKSIEVLAVEAYEFCNLDGFDDTVKFPLHGLGIGHRLAWFKSMMHRFYQAADSQLSFSF